MSYDPRETIVAPATAPGGAAEAIVRISGPDPWAAIEAVFRSDVDSPTELESARVLTGRLATGFSQPIPCQAYVWPTLRSFTRQPTVELHLPGSPPLVAATVEALCQAGARLAEPGEFTLRAFLAGRIDLPQAEAVLGVIDAPDSERLQTALAQLAGGLSQPLGQLRERLLNLLAELEAGLDFADEDIEFVSPKHLVSELTAAYQLVTDTAEQMATRTAAPDGARVVLTGWPNVGKSRLFNALAGREQAIVSQVPGTTRDYLVAEITIGGVTCELTDTAGWEPDSKSHERRDVEISNAAQGQTQQQSSIADVRLVCIDGSRMLLPAERVWLESITEGEAVYVRTKCDLPDQTDFYAAAIAVSSVTGTGLDALRSALADVLSSRQSTTANCVATTAARSRTALRHASECLARAIELTEQGGSEELIASELRVVLDSLGQVLGAIYTDDVLDRIFSRFCIGK